MGLYIANMAYTYPLAVWNDLKGIVGFDWGLGYRQLPGDPTAWEVTYRRTISAHTTTRVNELVNAGFSNPIAIAGVADNFVLAPGRIMSDTGGWTTWASYPNPPGPTELISCFYDVTDCSGAHYCVCGWSGKADVPFPTPLCLYHELAHAYHLANGTYSTIAWEVQAIDDENLARTQAGLPLRNYDYSCWSCPCAVASPPPPPPAPEAGTGGGLSGTIKRQWGCFVATAAYGSPEHSRVQHLRRVRDGLRQDTYLGERFFGEFYREYSLYSEPIVAAMEAAPAVKASVRRYAVEPLLTYFDLVAFYARSRSDETVFHSEVARQIRWSADNVLGPAQECDRSVINAARRWIGVAGCGRLLPEPGYDHQASHPLRRTFQYLGEQVRRLQPKAPYSAWALVQPLCAWLTLFEEYLTGSSAEVIADRFTSDVETWLSATPISRGFTDLPRETVLEDLIKLRMTLFHASAVRRGVSEQLLMACAPRSSYDLRAVLVEAGYLPCSQDDPAHA